jgi:hypothetical protein
MKPAGKNYIRVYQYVWVSFLNEYIFKFSNYLRMKRIFLIYYTTIACITVSMFTACNDLDLAPTNKFTDANYWTSVEKASSVLNMAYNQMFNSNYYFNTEALSDNLFQMNVGNEKLISSGQADASNGRFAGEWSDCYGGIKTCHTFLENIDRVPGMDEALKTRMIAEIRFIRAFLFFRLTTWYGDVPFFTQSLTFDESMVISRTSHADVIDFVRSELNEIAQHLPDKQEYASADNGRITKGAAMTLLARTYLYENDWANVASVCEKIINQQYGQYSLFGSYEGLFLPENEYNSEVILDIGYVPSLRTWSNYYDAIPPSVGGRVNAFAPTQALVDDYVMKNGKGIHEAASGYDRNNPYANRDPRFNLTIVYDGYQWKLPDGSTRQIYIRPGSSANANVSNADEYIQGGNRTATGYYLRKYYDPTAPAGMASGLNLILMRYADVLLMYAEAKNELGQMNEAIWNLSLRALRVRAGFTDPEALNYNANNLREAIRRERRCELAMEGLRIYDIRRWKTAEITLNGAPLGAPFGQNGANLVLDQRYFNKDRDYLWPVPQSQKDMNPNLGQNPNY